ncbi:MAG: aminoacyl-tRNA hydrolase [Solirubrobacterales bacterium]
MYLIAGLGNPGKQYEHTRHNVGFDTIDIISREYNIPLNREKFKGIYGEGTIADDKVILLKPKTFMNLSGESISEVSNFYKIESENIIVIYDDISLHTGRMRIRPQGSAGGHNGIKSIISCLSTEKFPRIKIGVGHPEYDLIPFVLGRFSKEDRALVEEVMKAAALSVEEIIKNGVPEAMNKYNSFKV